MGGGRMREAATSGANLQGGGGGELISTTTHGLHQEDAQELRREGGNHTNLLECGQGVIRLAERNQLGVGDHEGIEALEELGVLHVNHLREDTGGSAVGLRIKNRARASENQRKLTRQ